MLFSVIIPIYKVEDYLQRCVDSVLAQTFSDFELLLVDDGSPDGCGALCDAYAEKDSRVRVIHKPNGGLVSARNAGVFAARGDYVTYVDGDDWIKPNLLQFVHDRLLESPEPVDMVLFGADQVFQDRVEPLVNRVPDGWYDRARLEKEIFPYLLSDRRRGFYIGTQIQCHSWNKPCRRELQLAHYVRDERIRMFTDVPLITEILLDCRNVYICSEPLYCYNQCNTGSIISQGRMNFLTESFGCLVAYLQQRLTGFSPIMDRQLNDYPAHLIIRAAIWEINRQPSFFTALKNVRAGLKKSGLLRYVHLKGLPRNPKLLILLFKLHCNLAAMLLCAVKARKARRAAKEKAAV